MRAVELGFCSGRESPPGLMKLFSSPWSVAARKRQAESLKYKLLGGLAVRRACYGVLRFIMESGAKGAEVRRSAFVALACMSWARASVMDRMELCCHSENLIRTLAETPPGTRPTHSCAFFFYLFRSRLICGTSQMIQVIVAGKLRAQRAKSMKFRDGYMIKSGRVREGESSAAHYPSKEFGSLRITFSKQH